MSRLSERIENFNNSFLLYKKVQQAYISDKNNDVNRLALIQSFEIVFELGWKVLKDYLNSKDVDVLTPRDTIKAAFSANIIANGQIWIDMARDRNASSHEYNTDKIDKILEKISSIYYDELCNFSDLIKEFHD